MLYLTAPQAQSCSHQTCSSNLRRLDRKRLSSTYRLRCPPSSRVPDRIRNRSNSLMRLKVRLHIPRHSFHIIHLSIYPPTSPNAPQVQPSILSGPAQLTQQLALRIVTQLERRFNVSGCQQAELLSPWGVETLPCVRITLKLYLGIRNDEMIKLKQTLTQLSEHCKIKNMAGVVARYLPSKIP